MRRVSATPTSCCYPLIVDGGMGVITSAGMGFGAKGLGREGTVMEAVNKLVSARVAAISSTAGAAGASLTTGATNRSDRGAG